MTGFHRDIQWLNECIEVGDWHIHASVYLIETDDDYVLIDSGSFHDRENILGKIEAATDGSGIGTVLLTHADFPHSANAEVFRTEWEHTDLYASTGTPFIQGIPEAERCPIGGTMEIGGRTLEFVDPPLADRQHTIWIFDRGSHTLFTADAFGAYHRPAECSTVIENVEGSISLDNVVEFHRETLPWLMYVEPRALGHEIDRLFRGREVEAIAPIHGNPLVGDAVDEYTDRLEAAVERIAGEYEPPARRFA